MPTFKVDFVLDVYRDVKTFLKIDFGVERKSGVTDVKPQEQPLYSNKAQPSERQIGSRTGKGPRGSLPDFLIIGTQKGGTTSLQRTLREHPYSVGGRREEPHFFDKHFHRGLGWYLSLFPPPRMKNGKRVLVGEASPHYLLHPLAPKRAAAVVPGAKLVVLLRNPVDRAYSHFQHRTRTGSETLSFDKALEIEEDRLNGEWDKVLADDGYHSTKLQIFSYLTCGVYVDQLQRWHQQFGRERMLVERSEDFFANPEATTERIVEFLGLPDWRPASAKIANVGSYEEPMSPNTRRWLEEYFAPHNQRLYEYLGVDFGW